MVKNKSRHLIFKSLIGSNIVLYFLLIFLWVSTPEEKIINLILGAISILLTLVLLFLKREEFQGFYRSYKFKGMADTLFSGFLIFCILGLINFYFFKNPSQLDFSKQKRNTLGHQSVNIINKIKGPIDVKIFAKSEDLPQIAALFELYRIENSHINIEKIDIELRPDLVKNYHIEKNATALISYNGRTQNVIATSELEITNAFLKLTREKDPTLYFIQGHGEILLDEEGTDGLSMIKKVLEGQLYQVETLDLPNLEKINEEITNLIIWGPRFKFHPKEIEVLDQFLKRGGSLIVALDPNFNNDPVIDLRNLLKKWGLVIGNDLVVDRLNHYRGSNGSIPIIKTFNKEHKLTKNYKGPIFFPLVSSVAENTEGVMAKEKGYSYFSLLDTTPFPASWAEKNHDEIKSTKITFNEKSDIKGPISVFGIVESNKTKIAAFGNSSFIINGYETFGENYRFFLNTVSYINGEESLLSFNLDTPKDSPIFINGTQLGVIFYFSVVFMPLLLFLISILAYRKRVYA